MLNYIGVFLTFRCGLGCDYCINHSGELQPREEIPPKKWLKILQNLPVRSDLPITLQGGEPTQYPGFYSLVRVLAKRKIPLDLLTNGQFEADEFCALMSPSMFRSNAPYAGIRFSFHKRTNTFQLLTTALFLQRRGFRVGIWGLDHPDMNLRNSAMAELCRSASIDFRMKEYLDLTHGTYKYPDAITGKKRIKVHCYPSERLFAPDGKEFPCHRLLYANMWPGKKPEKSDHIICTEYGTCNPCDVKLKTNRLQEGGHCSVRIERI